MNLMSSFARQSKSGERQMSQSEQPSRAESKEIAQMPSMQIRFLALVD